MKAQIGTALGSSSVGARDRVRLALAGRSRRGSRAAPYLPSGGEVVVGLVDDLGLEHVARLLRHALAQVVIVDLHARHVALVARDHSSLPRHGTLHTRSPQ